jgi:hypothetical protein
MTQKQQRLLLYFLEVLEVHLRGSDAHPVSKEMRASLSRDDCIDIILWLSPECYHRAKLESLDTIKLYDALVTDYNVLLYVIHKWQLRLSKTISFSEDEVEMLFERTNNQTHYLYTKPTNLWDGYDRANYVSLLNKAGFTVRVFGIYSSEVNESDKYIVDSMPREFYDTEKEAKAEVVRLVEQENFSKEDLVVYPLYKIK